MVRTGLMILILATSICCSTLFAQDPPAQAPSDLQVVLRSASGSNRFQLGEVIPVEILISSSTPNRYLEPCTMFSESCFGFPQCRFFTKWAFTVIPNTGWTDIGWHGCMSAGGPGFDVQSFDLTAEPKKYPYTLTNRFRFDAPGTYTVRLSLTVGVDDETNQIRHSANSTVKPNSVSATAEMVLEIVPAGGEWKKDIVKQGMAAWTAPPPASRTPPSPEYLKYRQEKDALCNLGTPEAAVALAGLMSRGIDVTHCLKINAHKDVEEAEMRRLLVDPNTAIRPVFFAAYAKLVSIDGGKRNEIAGVTPGAVNEVRDTLFASLPKKTPEAMIPSLETVLINPMSGYWVRPGSAYDLRDPYSNEVIAMTAANFDRLSGPIQEMLLDTDWDHLRSPLMLPVVRREAEAGDGHALLRWLELDPAAAEVFVRQEVVRSSPRFSALFLRLPDESLPAQEQQQIARNFAALSAPQELIRSATLLHRYTTRATLPTVLPFIDQHLAQWPCNIQIPVLAYLLRVSPREARPRVEQVLQNVRPPYCPRGQFFPSLGFMQASPVLDTLAAKQVEDGTPLAADAAKYLGKYGSGAMKPAVWQQLSRWHKKLEESGAELRIENQKSTQDDWLLSRLDENLVEAYATAQAWTLSPEDVGSLSKLIGDKKMVALACRFSCGSPISVGPKPGDYTLYGRVNQPIYPRESRIDYLMPTEPFYYSVNQYGCRDLKALKKKLLEFPAGSTFRFANTGSLTDLRDWTAVTAFLRSHGYVVRN